MKNRLDYIMNNEEGMSNIEAVVMISTILMLIGSIWAYHDSIINLIKRGFNTMDKNHSGSEYISGS